jgi:Flp pilus assembly protein TadG
MFRAPGSSLRLFSFDRSGGIAVTFALSLPVMLGLVGGGIDYARLATRKSELQHAVDAGALAGGNALKLASSNAASVRGVVEQVVSTNAPSPPDRPLTITVDVASDKASVSARAEDTISLAFGRLIGIGSRTVGAQAKVSIVGKMRLCMLTLDSAAPGAFNLQKNAQVTALGCSLYSNSTSPIGMVGGASAMAQADTICSVGGYSGVRANFSPTPQTQCPVIRDPLQGRPTPSIGSCATLPFPFNLLPLTKTAIIDKDVTLEPGTYCYGLLIKKNAVVTLKPGIHVFKDGPLVVKDNATLTGVDVGLYFAGDKAGLLFDKKTTISLSAPTTGVMAGMLMSEQSSVTNPLDPALGLVDELTGMPITPTPPALGQTQPMRIYRIISNNARTMLGTIYLPSGRVVIDADRPVADQSAYTVLVARQVNLYEGPNLYLNANYEGTSVPVPKGVGPLGGRVVLSQ